MDEIFGELEERNLYLIHRKQEIEQAIESQTYEYRRLQRDLGKTHELHLDNKLELQEKIGYDQATLNELKKQTQLSLNIGS
jgi:hypothetical protein